MVFSTSKFESLSHRPPTPPKDIDKDVDEALQLLDDPFGTSALLSKPAPPARKLFVSTPDRSPSSDGPQSSSKRTKKVNFEIPACNSDPPPAASLTPSQWMPMHSSPLRPLPQTRTSKPLRSILKPHDPASTSPQIDDSIAAHKFQTFAEMLEFLTGVLARGQRSASLDAYVQLQKTMQAYDRVPDIQALQAKMPLLTQFNQRDVQATSATGKGLDTQLVQQALKFLMALVRVPEIRPANEFCCYMLDRSILIASGEAAAHKTIVNAHLAFLMQQSFTERSMTSSRAEKIIDVLQDIDKRVSGWSVQAYRIRIYRRLIQQRPEVMKAKIESWFPHTITAMFSVAKDLYQSALENVQMAAKVLGPDPPRAVLTILNRERTEGETFAKHLCRQLSGMLKSELRTIVPQIWAALTALLRGSFSKDKFANLNDWLKLFDSLLRSDAVAVRTQANIAFNSLVYAVDLSYSIDPLWSKLLLSILEQQLIRRNMLAKSQIESAMAGYYTLLYYALHQTNRETAEKELDRYFRDYVADFWQRLIGGSSKNALPACRVASALFMGSRKAWNQARVLDLKHYTPVQMEELPMLSPTWVRKNMASVLKFVETCLNASVYTTENEPIRTMWTALLDSLVEASSKEVVASVETKDAVAHIINLLRRLWYTHISMPAMQQQTEDGWVDRFCFMIEAVIQKLGAQRFADKSSTRNQQDELEAAPTPSHSHRRANGRLSPLLYLVDLIINQSEEKLSDAIRLRILKVVLEPCLESRQSRFLKLELLKDCAAAIHPALKSPVAAIFAEQLLSLANKWIRASARSNQASEQLGNDYAEITRLLVATPRYLQTSTAAGEELLVSLFEVVKAEAGDGAVVLVIENICETIWEELWAQNQDASLHYITIILNSMPEKLSNRTMEQGRRNLWPSAGGSPRSTHFDPYKYFYLAVDMVLVTSYTELQFLDLNSVKTFLAVLSVPIQRCGLALLGLFLRKIQHGVATWIEDPKRKLQDDSPSIRELSAEVTNLWRTINAAIERLPRKDNTLLEALGELVTSGFLSRRRSIANVAITTWNKTFGQQESLNYPNPLQDALRKLQDAAELSLPGFPQQEANVEEEDLTFYGSDTDLAELETEFDKKVTESSPFCLIKPIRSTRSPASTASTRRPVSRQASRLRLRHDNSQIHFEAIDVSPTNRDDQESQILTERQREMIEEQRLTAQLYSDIGSTRNLDSRGSTAPQRLAEVRSNPPVEKETAPTPSKSRAPAGFMDEYLGSSPTPRTLSRRELLSDDTDVATPTSVRSMRLAEENEELGSSPPRLVLSGDTVADSFCPPAQQTMANIDTEATSDGPEDDLPTDVGSELPSSAVDLQLTAQISAEMTNGANIGTGVPQSGVQDHEMSADDFVDAPSQQLLSELPVADMKFNGDEQERTVHVQSTPVVLEENEGSTEISRIDDSFPPPAARGPQLQDTRRSSQVTGTPSRREKNKKRKQSEFESPNKSKKIKEDEVETNVESFAFSSTQEDEILDCIVVDVTPSPSVARHPTPRRSASRMPSESPAPSSGRKRGRPRKRNVDGQAKPSDDLLRQSLRRHSSKLSQMEEADVVEETPAPKRVRISGAGDVSAAKATSPKPSRAAEVKRLSHVQVIPKKVKDKQSGANDKAPTQPDAHIEGRTSTSQGDTAAVGEMEHSQSHGLGDETNAPSTPTIESTATPLRRILTPRSVLGRLKNMLSEFSQLVLGRQEEREFDDVLFEMRRHVHEAGRRGEGRN